MYKQDLEQTLLGIDEEAELEIGPRDDRPSVVLVGGSAFMLNDVTNRSVTHDIDVFEADRCLREIIARYPEGMVWRWHIVIRCRSITKIV